MINFTSKFLCVLLLVATGVLSKDLVPEVTVTPERDYTCSNVQALYDQVNSDKSTISNIIDRTIPSAKDVLAEVEALIQKSYQLVKKVKSLNNFLQSNTGSSLSAEIEKSKESIDRTLKTLDDSEFSRVFNEKINDLIQANEKGSKEDSANIEAAYQALFAEIKSLQAFLDTCSSTYTDIVNNQINPRLASYQAFISKCNSKITVLAAFYGVADVTSIVQAKVDSNGGLSASFNANNALFTDPWVGIKKSCVVYWQLGNGYPNVAIAQENGNIAFSSSDDKSTGAYPSADGLQIVGCAYGLADVTSKCQGFVSDNKLSVQASNGNFGDSWYGIKKSLNVAYRVSGGAIQTKSAKEGETLSIA